MIRIFENEGYIQMSSSSQCSQNKKTQKIFNIPNKEYYNREKAKQIYQTFQERDVLNNISIFFQNTQDFIQITTNKLKLTNTPLTVSNPLII